MAAFELEMWSAVRHGRVLTKAVRSPVSLATGWIGVVSLTLGCFIAGRIVARWRDNIDFRPLWANTRRQEHHAPIVFAFTSTPQAISGRGRFTRAADPGTRQKVHEI
jgi:hypothetical protein